MRRDRRVLERRTATGDIRITPAVRAYLAAFDRTLSERGQESAGTARAREAAFSALRAARVPRVKLSAREAEVFRLRASGVPRARIAVLLGIAPRTVDNHLSNVAVKLGTSDPYRLALLALALRLTGPQRRGRA